VSAGPENLPIQAVLPDLLAALRAHTSAVLIAPPGAGKTTAVAPALLGEPWCQGTVILLSPRRVAARAAAERMADMLGEQAGETVGYLTRLDSRRSAKTRILVMTEAIFVATILGDPELSGVSAVLFDEAHERHLDSDLGLALAAECQAVLREDLRLLVMSATLDGGRFAALLGDCAVIESQGKAFPLAVRWLGARPGARRRGIFSPSCRASERSTARPSASPKSCRLLWYCHCMASASPRPSERRSSAILKGADGSCSPPRSPRPR
jgi:ATP-dependent helicase HrpB